MVIFIPVYFLIHFVFTKLFGDFSKGANWRLLVAGGMSGGLSGAIYFIVVRRLASRELKANDSEDKDAILKDRF